ncbi:hypothetical protein [Dyadobacter frigoris]|uniref:Uncharacterized protein n=1 Tax=Dyadobacter frigoris TaxID=2576211 RepID=A0A4U6D2K9_9BACT|nr:hypothetical protein [Dyadobacter frigoris]TKT91480.1 hypothetical protein FDK13_13995 [Dyadobacter frigoris]GLU51964.1 hypothetical protein Dfri01_14250 [Dyadobacter frigoris]
MKKVSVIILGLLVSSLTYGQPCKLLTDTFREADKLRNGKGESQRFRFSENQLDQVKLMPGLEKPVIGLKSLQKTLDQDYQSYLQGLFWQLDEKLAAHQVEEVKKECPETSFKVYEDEVLFYKSKYRVYDEKIDKGLKRNGN